MADTILSDSVSKDDSGHTNLALQRIQLSNLLSFGPDTPPLSLRPLNILIGANGSGKSNLIDAISLLRSCAGDIQSTLRRGGGVLEWIWKGNPQGVASIEAIVTRRAEEPLRHKLDFAARQQTFQIVDEVIEDTKIYGDYSNLMYYYRYQNGSPIVNTINFYEDGSPFYHEYQVTHTDRNLSALKAFSDELHYPEIAHISNQYNALDLLHKSVFTKQSTMLPLDR